MIGDFPYDDCRIKEPEKISVIVSVYNIAAYLERSITSILRQTYGNLEIILVDDGSTDESPGILDAFAGKDERIRVIHKKNGGPSEARNAGLAQATGSCIGFVDGDDFIDACYYERMLYALQAYDADLCISRYRNVYRDRTEDDSTDRAAVLEGQEALELYIGEEDSWQIKNAVWNKLYRRHLLEDLVFPPGKWYEDILYTTALLGRTKRSVYLDRAAYNYIIDREGSIMNTGVNPRIFTDQISAYEAKTAFLEALGRPDLARLHDYHYFRRLLLLYRDFWQSQLPERKEACDRIRQLIADNGERIEKAYACREAAATEKRQMRRFRKSPGWYLACQRLQERAVTPAKAAVKRVLTRGKKQK